MIRRTLSILVVVLVVVTAGCVGGGDPGAIPDNGATDDGGDGTSVETADGGDAATVAANQSAVLRAAGSYTSVWRMRVLEAGEQVSEVSYVTAMNYDAERYSFETRNTDRGRTRTNAAAYFADGRSYQRFGEGEEATYASNDADFGMVSMSGTSRAAFVSGFGDLEAFSYAGTETYDGVSVRRYVMDERPLWLAAQGQADGDGEIRWTDFSYEVLVDDHGLVRSEVWSSTGVDDAGTETVVEFTYELSGVGSTDVAEPAWVAAADS